MTSNTLFRTGSWPSMLLPHEAAICAQLTHVATSLEDTGQILLESVVGTDDAPTYLRDPTSGMWHALIDLDNDDIPEREIEKRLTEMMKEITSAYGAYGTITGTFEKGGKQSKRRGFCLAVGNFVFEMGWYPGDDFRLFGIDCLEISTSMITIVGLTIARFSILLWYDKEKENG